LCPAGKASFGGLQACEDCSGAGEYSVGTKNTVCSIVGPGKKPALNREGSELCPAGRFSTGSVDVCEECVGGHSDLGASSCTATPPGYYWDGTQDVPCPAGTFSANGASELAGCEDCMGLGEFSAAGAAYCSTNAAGTKAKADKTGFETCPSNTFSTGATYECTACDASHSEPGSSSCIDTPSGHYWGGNSDVPCPVGRFSLTGATSITGCLYCVPGFVSASGSGYCSPCSAGEHNNTASSKCVECQPGAISGIAATHCKNCEKGKYAANAGNDACSFCDLEIKGSSTLSAGASSMSDCECGQGDFLSKETGHCEQVAEGVNVTVSGMTVANLHLESGFWRVSSDSIDIRRCYSPDACLGGPNSTCADGHTGAYCGVCVEGYSELGTSASGMTCVECTGNSTQSVILFVTLFILVLSLPAIYSCIKRRKKKDADLDDLATEFERDKERLAKFDKKRKKAHAFLNHIQTPFKILLSYAQIASGFSFNFGIHFPPFFTTVMSFFSFANLDFVSLTPMGCVIPITYHDQLLGYTLLPLVAFASMFGVYVYLGKRDHARHELRDAVFNSLLLLTFLVLPTTSTKILNMFACDELDDGSRVLKGDLGIDCDGAEHMAFQVFAAIMIAVYPVGIPLMYFVMLYKAKGLLDRGQARLLNTKIVKLVEETEEVAEEGEERDEVGDEASKVAEISGYVTKQGEIEDAVLQGDIVLENKWTSLPSAYIEFMAKQSNVSRIFWHGDMLGVEVTLNEHEAMQEALRLRELDEEEHTGLGRMKFLYAAYEPNVWWFEVFETCRRLLLTGGQVLLNPGTPSQIVLNMIVCLFSMKVYAVYKPFVNSRSDRLAEVMQWQLFFTMLAALCIKVDITGEDNYNKKTFDLALGLMQCVGPLLLVYQAFVYSGKGKKKQRKVGGAMDEVRMMANSIAAERKSAMGEEGSGAGRFLRTVSSGIGLGSSFSRKNEGGRQWADEDLTAQPPPPEGLAPTWDNNVFTNGKARAAQDIEMRSNPLHGDKVAGAVKKAKDIRHLDRAVSGGYKAKATAKSKGPARKRGESAAENEAAAIAAAPVSEEEWSAHVDPDSGAP